MNAGTLGILLLGFAVLIILGMWGWLAAAKAVVDSSNPVLAAITVYGFFFGALITGGVFTYFVWRIRHG
jgi:hypothetical protein